MCVVESLVGASFLVLAKVMQHLLIEGQEAFEQGLLYCGIYALMLFILLTLRSFYKFKNSRIFV